MARPGKILSKEQIEHAVENSRSYHEAARYLKVSYNTFKKYAQAHDIWIKGGINPTAKGIPKTFANRPNSRSLDRILDGERNGRKLNLTKLRERLIRECILEEKCYKCGFKEKRLTDDKVPLKLSFIDGDRTNYKKENLLFLCLNHSFLLEGNIVGRKKTYYTDDSGDIYENIGDK